MDFVIKTILVAWLKKKQLFQGYQLCELYLNRLSIL